MHHAIDISLDILLWAKTKVNLVIKWKIFIYLSKSISSPPPRYNALMPTFFPVVETLVKFDFRNCLLSLLRFGLYLFNHVKTVSSERSFEFWKYQKSREAKSGKYGGCGMICVEFLEKWSTTSCLPKISFETLLSDPFDMSIVSARSLIVNRRFSCTNSLIWLTCCSSVDVDGHPGRSKSSTRSLPSLKSLYHL